MVDNERKKKNMELYASSQSEEWYTPKYILEKVVAVLDEIDLDPCSNSKTAPNVPAKNHFTIEDDALVIDNTWNGKVFMNPPYGKKLPSFTSKLIEEFKSGRVSEAIALVPGRTDTRWLQYLMINMGAICMVKGRIKFEFADGTKSNSSPFPSVALYFGYNVDKFSSIFSSLGPCLVSYVDRTVINKSISGYQRTLF